MSETALPENEQKLQAEIVRLNKIVKALMDRVEKTMSAGGSDFGVFQTTIMLENQVRDRTRELEAALSDNERINRALQREKEEQRKLIAQLEETQTKLLHAEKLASVGQLAAGIAHEINNPIGFMNSNLGTMGLYFERLLRLIDAYEEAAPFDGAPQTAQRIEELKKEIHLKRIRADAGHLVEESIEGTERVRNIVKALRNFSRAGDVEWTSADLNEELSCTLDLARNELREKCEVVKEFGTLPFVECVPSQINQVFMNLILNAAQFMAERGTITLRTGVEDEVAWVSVGDTGVGIPQENLAKIFDPFFTTKPFGQGQGLGLAVAYGIVKAHDGEIRVESRPGQGTTFTIRLPIRRKAEQTG